MTSQYRHLTAIAAEPAVTVQVMTAIPPVLSGSFTVHSLTDNGEPAVTCHQAPAGRIITRLARREVAA